MLVVLFGVSGVGRTSVIRSLCTEHNWKYIPVYTTRQHRKNEEDLKHPISLPIFREKQLKGEFHCVTCVYNNYYGFCSTCINKALNSHDELWVVDFALSNVALLGNIPFVGILLLPENIDVIIHRLMAANREYRIKEVLRRLESDKQQLISGNVRFVDCVIVNKHGKLMSAVNSIVSLDFPRLNSLKLRL